MNNDAQNLPDFNSSAFELLAINKRELLEATLTAQIESWIATDYNKLIEVLYRLDIDEQQLRQKLDEHDPEKAASVMANMIIDRQIQKLHSRQENKPSHDIPDDEKW